MRTNLILPVFFVLLPVCATNAQQSDVVWMRGGHTGEPNAVIFTTDSRTLVSAGADRVVRFWDPQSRMLVAALPVPGSGIASLSRSEDGRILAAGDIDGSVHFIDPSSHSLVRSIKVTSQINCLKFSADGRRMLVGSPDGSVVMISSDDGSVLQRYVGHPSGVAAVDISSDDSLVATAGEDYTTRIWNATTGALVRTIQEVQFASTCVAFTPDGRRVAAIGYDSLAGGGLLARNRGVVIFDALTGRSIMQAVHGHVKRVTSATFSRDGRYLATSALDYFAGGTIEHGPTVFVLDLVNGRTWSTEEYEDVGGSNGVAFSPDGRWIAWALTLGHVRLGSLGDTIGPVVLRHSADEWVPTVTDQTGTVRAMAISPDGDTLASTGPWSHAFSQRDLLRTWTTPTGTLLNRTLAHAMPVRSLAWSHDGSRIVSASGDGTVKIWSSHGLALLRTLYVSAESPATCAAMARNGRVYVSIGAFEDVAVQLDSNSSARRLTFSGSTSWLNAVALSPDESRLAGAGNDGSVWVWNAETAALLASSDASDWPVQSIAYGTDGTLIFAGDEHGTIRMLDAETGSTVYSVRGHTAAVSGLAATSDGRYVVSASLDSSITVWSIEAEDLREVYRYRDYPAGYSAVAIDRAARYVAAGTDDATVIVHRFRTTSEAEEVGPTISQFSARITPIPASVAATLDLLSFAPANCRVTIHDARGTLVAVPFEGFIGIGHTRARVSLAGLASGPYFLHAVANGQVSTAILIKR